MKKLWKIIKENITVVLAMTTAFLSVVYAGIRLMIYVYWMGYFKELNIDANVMNINYEGNLFQVIFLAGLLLLLFYVFAMMDEGFKKYSEAIKKEQQSKIKRIFAWSKTLWKCFWRSLFLLSIANLPLTWVIGVMANMDMMIPQMCVLTIMLYIFEMIMYFIFKLQKKEENSGLKSWEDKVGVVILCGCVICSFILAGLYYSGSQQTRNQREFRMVSGETYAITYSDREHYVLHRSEINGDEILIHRNEQKIIGVEDCEYSVVNVKKVEVVQ